MEQHCFAFYLTDSYSQIKKVLDERCLPVDGDGFKLVTPIRKWLSYKPANEVGVSLITHGIQHKAVQQQQFLETCWGIGFRIETLKRMFPVASPRDYWDNYDFDRDLLFFKLKPYSTIKFADLNIMRDIIILCPTESDREQLILGYNEYKASRKPKRYKIWHWMSASHKTVTSIMRTDKEFDEYMSRQFDTRNWTSKESNDRGVNTLF